MSESQSQSSSEIKLPDIGGPATFAPAPAVAPAPAPAAAYSGGQAAKPQRAEPEGGDQKPIARAEEAAVLTRSLFCDVQMHNVMNTCCVHCLVDNVAKIVTKYPNQRAIHVYSTMAEMANGVSNVLWHYKVAAPPYFFDATKKPPFSTDLKPSDASWQGATTIIAGLV
jgi:hypothetical protein